MSAAKSLVDKTILITSPADTGQYLASNLQKLGAQPILMPMIKIKEPNSFHELDTAIQNLSFYQWLFFVSKHAALAFIERLMHCYKSTPAKDTQLPQRLLDKLPKIAVIGQSTKKLVEQYGMKVAYCPSKFIAENFIEEFPVKASELSGVNILWPRANIGRDLITEKFQKAGAKIDVITAYNIELPDNVEKLNNEINSLLSNEELDAILFTSKQTARNLAWVVNSKENQEIMSGNLALAETGLIAISPTLKKLFESVLIVTIGPETSEGVLNYLGKVDLEANPHTADGLIRALVEHYKG